MNRPLTRRANQWHGVIIAKSVRATERVNVLVHAHHPIAAIALVREATGAGIVACKAYVDDLATRSPGCPLHCPRG